MTAVHEQLNFGEYRDTAKSPVYAHLLGAPTGAGVLIIRVESRVLRANTGAEYALSTCMQCKHGRQGTRGQTARALMAMCCMHGDAGQVLVVVVPLPKVAAQCTSFPGSYGRKSLT